MNQIQLKITLKGFAKSIWRRVVISSEMTLLELHDLIQIVMGWEDRHLFMFEIGPFRFVDPDQWEESAYRYQSASRAIMEEIISKFVQPGEYFIYEYDMGDSWQHEILVEKIISNEEYRVPVVLVGSRACPPEDAGGPGGYAYLLEVLQNPSHGEYESYRNWVGGNFDPARFNLSALNKGLKTKLKNKTIIRESYWRQGDYYFFPVSFESEWTQNISSNDAAIAESLTLRRDIVTLLEYLKHHSVRGTKSTGNFPRKHVRAISAKLVNPPELDLVLGDRIYEMRSEDEVLELMFLHSFTNTAGLIFGAEGLIWQVTPIGMEFLERDPYCQVWYLTSYWLTRVNWYFAYLYDDYSEVVEINTFSSITQRILLDYPVSGKIYLEDFIDRINNDIPNWLVANGYRNLKDFKDSFICDVLIEPFRKFGLIQIPNLSRSVLRYHDVEYFYLTDYGRSLLLSVK